MAYLADAVVVGNRECLIVTSDGDERGTAILDGYRAPSDAHSLSVACDQSWRPVRTWLAPTLVPEGNKNCMWGKHSAAVRGGYDRGRW